MKSQSLIVALCGFVATSSASCANNCARAVIASAFTTISGARDCSKYLATTVTPATVTYTSTVTTATDVTYTSVYTEDAVVTDTTTISTETDVVVTGVVISSTEVDSFTVTDTLTASTETDVSSTTLTITTTAAPPAKRQPTSSPSPFPAYASACSSFAAYSSACASCLGVQGTTVTAPAPSTTVTVTVASTSTASLVNTLSTTETLVESVTATTSITSTSTSETVLTISTTQTDVVSVTATTSVISVATQVATCASTGFTLTVVGGPRNGYTMAVSGNGIYIQAQNPGVFQIDSAGRLYSAGKYAVSPKTGTAAYHAVYMYATITTSYGALTCSLVAGSAGYQVLSCTAPLGDNMFCDNVYLYTYSGSSNPASCSAITVKATCI
ncbi:hypothetical protein BR93DRAFT_940941 [Coniochaeta sp. PMI_546]|nr:hypothetical protein BR93DRAFT_940941 [Coniochaeta sp. PMI_546]